MWRGVSEEASGVTGMDELCVCGGVLCIIGFLCIATLIVLKFSL